MKIIKTLIICLAVNILNLIPAWAGESAKGITVSDAWVESMPPSDVTTAAFMTITNSSARSAVLISASCDLAEATEIHQMSRVDGMMHMSMLDHLQIPAQDKVILEPDGIHIMLINLKKSLKKGDVVPIDLRFNDGSDLKVKADVRDL